MPPGGTSPPPGEDPDRDTEPRRYDRVIPVPPPPHGWPLISVKTIHDVVVIGLGGWLLFTQSLVAYRGDEPTWWVIFAGLTCLGYDVALTKDLNQKRAREQVLHQNGDA
jgi:hypothetical protein